MSSVAWHEDHFYMAISHCSNSLLRSQSSVSAAQSHISHRRMESSDSERGVGTVGEKQQITQQEVQHVSTHGLTASNVCLGFVVANTVTNYDSNLITMTKKRSEFFAKWTTGYCQC